MHENKKNLVLGVTGSIAAFKAAELVSMLSKSNFNVNVIMTKSACELVTERTFFTLSKNPVVTSLWELPEWKPGHISLAEAAFLLVIAPCTANAIAKLAHGIADDALSTYALSHKGPVLLAPAMNSSMWTHPAVAANCETLRKRGAIFVGPAAGPLACGTEGVGRMEDVRVIFDKIVSICGK